jgi:hypothetical protein
MAKQLNPGDQFPNYIVQLADGRTLNIPQELSGEYAVIIFLPWYLVTLLRSAVGLLPSAIDQFKEET